MESAEFDTKQCPKHNTDLRMTIADGLVSVHTCPFCWLEETKVNLLAQASSTTIDIEEVDEA